MWFQTVKTGIWKSCPVSERKWLTLFKRVSRGGCETHSQKKRAAFTSYVSFSRRACFISLCLSEKLLSLFVLRRHDFLRAFRLSPLCMLLPVDAVVTLSPPPPSLLLSIVCLTSPRSLVAAHSRQRQNSVGMNTPNATRMGNIRLLLSAAYGFGVRGPDWTLYLEPTGTFFFPPSSPPSLSSSSSSSSSCFSKPGWGWSFGTSVKKKKIA